MHHNQRIDSVAKAARLSASYIAIAGASSTELRAQAASQAPAAQSGASQLPAVQIDEPNRKPRRPKSEPGKRSDTVAVRRRETPRTPPQPSAAATAAWAPANT